jgi:hypothetical protein
MSESRNNRVVVGGRRNGASSSGRDFDDALLTSAIGSNQLVDADDEMFLTIHRDNSKFFNTLVEQARKVLPLIEGIVSYLSLHPTAQAAAGSKVTAEALIPCRDCDSQIDCR